MLKLESLTELEVQQKGPKYFTQSQLLLPIRNLSRTLPGWVGSHSILALPVWQRFETTFVHVGLPRLYLDFFKGRELSYLLWYLVPSTAPGMEQTFSKYLRKLMEQFLKPFKFIMPTVHFVQLLLSLNFKRPYEIQYIISDSWTLCSLH